jgi:hypothetical protein
MPSGICFFISPIGEPGSGQRKAADAVLRHLVRKALDPLELDVIRADEDEYPGLITARTIKLIRNADLIVADLTGHNPNVFYEMAVAHGFQRPVVHIQQIGEVTPFDVRDMRILRYDMTDLDELERARAQLTVYAQKALEHAEIIETPLSIAGRFLEINQSNDPILASQTHLIEMVEALRGDIRRLKAEGSLLRGRSEIDQRSAEIGITRVSVGGSGGTVLVEKVRTSRVIRIIATSAVRFIESNTSSLVEALANGCDLRILLPEPEGIFVKEVELLEGLERERPTRIADEIRTVIVALSGALQEAAEFAGRERSVSPLGTVNVGYFSTQLRMTMILCDESWGWVTMTLPPSRSTDCPSLELSGKGTRPLLSLCQAHFDQMWELCDRAALQYE